MDLDLYDFIKDNYSLSSNLLFQQHMYNNRYEFKDYLQNFILSKAEKPLVHLIYISVVGKIYVSN